MKKRETLTEIEKFYIQQNCNTMALPNIIENFAKDYPNVSEQAVRAYILNMPVHEVRQPPKSTTTVKSKEMSRTTALFASRDGIAIMTQGASEAGDIANPMTGTHNPVKDTPYNKNVMKVIPDKPYNKGLHKDSE